MSSYSMIACNEHFAIDTHCPKCMKDWRPHEMSYQQGNTNHMPTTSEFIAGNEPEVDDMCHAVKLVVDLAREYIAEYGPSAYSKELKACDKLDYVYSIGRGGKHG